MLPPIIEKNQQIHWAMLRLQQAMHEAVATNAGGRIVMDDIGFSGRQFFSWHPPVVSVKESFPPLARHDAA